MRKALAFGSVFLPLINISVWPMAAHAALATSVVISEIQTASATDAWAEFVELYNPTSADVTIDGWVLQYHATGATSAWATKSKVTTGVIKAEDIIYLVHPSRRG